MANRPVFVSIGTAPYRMAVHVEFEYNRGLAASQKKKNVLAIHSAFQSMFPQKRVLEISSKSMQEGGQQLSAFHLKKYVPSLGKSIAAENIYQSGKVFRDGGPYTDLLLVSPRDAKRDERLRTSGPLIGFRFEGQDFPLQPQTAFYDYIYIRALMENEELANIVLGYDAFTDVEFGPARSLNCQAQAAALFVSLHRLGMTDRLHSFEEFLDILQPKHDDTSAAVPQHTPEHPTQPERPIQPGSRIFHKSWGNGTVTAVSGTVAEIDFPSVGKKKLGLQWLLQNCSPGD